VYTRCPDCATVFRVTAEALRVAQGDVRCGVCSNTFNAIENLSEQAFKPELEEVEGLTPDDSMTVEELPGGESIELSEESTASAEDEAKAMEFHGDATELDRLFVVEATTPPNFDPAKVAASLSLAESALDRTDEYPILVLDERDAPEESIFPDPAPARDPDPPPAPAPAAAAFGSSSRILIPEEMRRRLIEEAAARTAPVTDFDPVESSDRRRWPWRLGVALALLLFGIQVVHSQREQLVRGSGFGPWLARAYALVGQPLDTPSDLKAYELRQWGAANDPTQAGRLLLRASIVNRATFAQPMPLLRLSLQDRLGETMGVRDIAPADYLRGAGMARRLGPGQRADAEIRIVDPGKDAVGFEMDVCLLQGDGIHCANQALAAP
jgi:predicted Zn finger-like uncharacterized protein